MGAQNSKVEKITRNVVSIRGSIRRDKSKINEDVKNQLQNSLIAYSEELSKLNKKAKRKEIQDAHLLIANVSQELQAISSNSDINILNNDKKVKDILSDLVKIENKVKTTRISRDERNKLQKTLISYSQLLSKKQKEAKREEIDKAQKQISYLIRELITKQDDQLDSAAVETNSFTLVSNPPEATKTNSKIDVIDRKLEGLIEEINQATINKNSLQLQTLASNVKDLMTDLQMVKVQPKSLLEEKKFCIEKELVRHYHRLEKYRKQVSREDNIEYLTGLQKKNAGEQIAKLDELEKGIAENQNINKSQLDVYKDKIKAVEEINGQVKSKKNDLLGTLNNFETNSSEIKLTQAEEALCKFQTQVNRYSYSADRDQYHSFEKYLQDLKEYVAKLEVVDQNVENRKQKFLINVDKSLTILQCKTSEEISPVDKLLMSYKSYQREFSVDGYCLEDLYFFVQTLKEIQSSLGADIKDLEQHIDVRQYNKSEDPVLVTCKERTIDSGQLFQKRSDSTDEFEIDIATIEQEIARFWYVEDSDDYNITKQNIDTIRKKLRRLYLIGDDSNRAKINILNKQVDKIKQKLKDKSITFTKPNRNSTDDILSDIMSVGERVNDLGQKITSVNVLRKEDLDSIQSNLMEHYDYLQNLDLRAHGENIRKSRDLVLNDVNNNLRSLDHFKSRRNTVLPDELEFTKELNTLKRKVSRFSGNYQNVFYKNLEDGLKKCLTNVNQKVNNPQVAQKIKADIGTTLKILEEKSTKDGQYVNVVNKTMEKLGKIRDDVKSVEFELKVATRKTKEEYKILDGRLRLCIVALDNTTLKDDGYKEDIMMLHEEIQNHLSYIKEQIFILDQTPSLEMPPKASPAEIATIEQCVGNLREEITAFVGVETCRKFLELDEGLINNTLHLDSLVFDKNNPLQIRKNRLMQEIQSLSELLDSRIEETTRMINLERELREIEAKIESLPASIQEDNYDKLDEKVVNLNLKIGKFVCCDQLSARKDECSRRVGQCLKRLRGVSTSSLPRKKSNDEELLKIEQIVKQIKHEILSFVGLEDSQKFMELDDSLVQFTLKLDSFNFTDNKELQSRKMKIIEEIQNCSDILDSRVKESEEMEKMEEKINQLKEIVESKSSVIIEDTEFNDLDEKLINLQLKVSSFGCVEQLISRKNSALRNVEYCLKKLGKIKRKSRNFSQMNSSIV